MTTKGNESAVGSAFECRTCRRAGPFSDVGAVRILSYKSCETHDARVDKLAKDSGLLREALQSNDVRQNMLGIRAYRMAFARMQRTDPVRGGNG